MLIRWYVNFLYKVIKGEYRSKTYTPPSNPKELKNFVGKMGYVEDPKRKGFVKINPAWIKENLVILNLPVPIPLMDKFWTIQVHKKLALNVRNLFYDYIINKYDNLYPIYQLGGFVPRHKLSNPTKSLSLHAYGMAIDINWKENKLNTRGNMPVEVVTLFKQYGWQWGGFWRRPKDPMHFQYYVE